MAAFQQHHWTVNVKQSLMTTDVTQIKKKKQQQQLLTFPVVSERIALPQLGILKSPAPVSRCV